MAIGRSLDGCGTGAGDDCDIEDDSTRGMTFVGGEGKSGDGKTIEIDKTSGTRGRAVEE